MPNGNYIEPIPTSDRPPGATRFHAALLLASHWALLFWPPVWRPGAHRQHPVAKASSSSGRWSSGAHIASLQSRGDTVPAAAQATQEGHWRFINRAGETFTAGTPDEMRRAGNVLYPDKAGTRLALYVTEDTVFQHRAALKALPVNAELFVVAGLESYRVLRRVDGAAERLFAEVAPSGSATEPLLSQTAWTRPSALKAPCV